MAENEAGQVAAQRLLLVIPILVAGISLAQVVFEGRTAAALTVVCVAGLIAVLVRVGLSARAGNQNAAGDTAPGGGVGGNRG
ncbi:hypothetical protein [Streptomyces glaucescens]|uniref:Putative membrane protein n=1 Tax=Streptomyces glaucescens TaxID=1907 RepID=A0A089XEU3_STRGA|nr:hypothetical protein [Streptomyces glaucescens]AIR99689.1 putative membrane protein [Streptomyces glaucescens]